MEIKKENLHFDHQADLCLKKSLLTTTTDKKYFIACKRDIMDSEMV